VHVTFKSQNHDDRPLGRSGMVGGVIYFIMGLTKLEFEEED